MTQKFSFEDLRLSGELDKGDAIRFLTKASMAGVRISPMPHVVTSVQPVNPNGIESICQPEQYVGREHFEDYAAKYEPGMARNNVGRVFNAAIRSGIPSDITRRQQQVISGKALDVVYRTEVHAPDYVVIAGQSAFGLDQASLLLAKTYAVRAQSLLERVSTAFQRPGVAEEFLDTLGIVIQEQLRQIED